MARGGKRSGAGRKKGSVSKRSQEVAAEITATGKLPLAYMLDVMRDEAADTARRDEMARAAAPFVHPRLSSIDGDLNLHIHKHEEALAELE